MIAELKPCPFCRAELDEQAPGYFAHPASTNCILSMQEYDFDGAPELAELWNRRAQPAEEVQQVGYMARHVSGSWNPLLTADYEGIARDLSAGWSYQPVYSRPASSRCGDGAQGGAL